MANWPTRGASTGAEEPTTLKVISLDVRSGSMVGCDHRVTCDHIGRNWSDLIGRQKKRLRLNKDLVSPTTSSENDCTFLRQLSSIQDFTSRKYFNFVYKLASSFASQRTRMTGTSNNAPTRRGALIVVEGLDRAGKSSQCEMLRNYLSEQGHIVKYIRFPGISASRLFQRAIALMSPQTGPHRSASS